MAASQSLHFKTAESHQTVNRHTHQIDSQEEIVMSSDNEQIHFDITLGSDDQVTIEAEGCSITSEYIADKRVRRTTMNPVKILFSAFAL